MHVTLSQLPESHPLRRTPFREINAECRNLLSKRWRPVAQWKIGSATFNELGPAWKEFNEFRIKEENAFSVDGKNTGRRT